MPVHIRKEMLAGTNKKKRSDLKLVEGLCFELYKPKNIKQVEILKWCYLRQDPAYLLGSSTSF